MEEYSDDMMKEFLNHDPVIEEMDLSRKEKITIYICTNEQCSNSARKIRSKCANCGGDIIEMGVLV